MINALTVHALDAIKDLNSIAIDCKYPVTDDGNNAIIYSHHGLNLGT